MSVVIETTIGDFTVDLYAKERPRTAMNFLKLCKMKFYNFQLFFKVTPNFVCQAGDPSLSGRGGESVFRHLYGEQARYFEAEKQPRLKHLKLGTLSMVDNGEGMLGSQFLITLSDSLDYLDEQHCVFGEVVEGMEFLSKINDVICDKDQRPLQDIMITHTVVLDDPFEEPENVEYPPSPEPTLERLKSDRIACYEDIDDFEGKTAQEIEESMKDKEAKAQATILEIIGDLPDADMAPPENVLFVCKLNPVTNDDDLELIFSRFGEIKTCEIIRDRKSGESLQYAFIEFAQRESCEQAYFKMDNVLIDDRRIHVDFSQSVAKVKWKGKGRGVVGSWSENEKKGNKFDERSRDKYVIRDYRKKDGYKLILDDEPERPRQRRNSRERKKSRSPQGRKNYRKNSSPARDRRTSPTPRKNSPSGRDWRANPAPRNRSPPPRNRSPAPRNRGPPPRNRSPPPRNRSPAMKERKRSPTTKDRSNRDRRSRSRERDFKSKPKLKSRSRSRDRDRERKLRKENERQRSRSRDRASNRREEQSRRRSRSPSRDYLSKRRR